MTSERMSERKALAHSIQEAIDSGAKRVEAIHKSIVDLPLKLLEESALLKRPAREVRRLQDRSITAVYDLIRGVNRQVGTLASELLARAARRRAHPGADGGHHAATG